MSWSLVDLWAPGETERSDDLDRRNRELNQKKLDRGQLSPEWVTAQQERFESTGSGTFNGQIMDAAAEGAVEGLQSMPGKVRAALNSVGSWAVSFIPWWAWVIGLLVLVGYLGGFTRLRGILARRA